MPQTIDPAVVESADLFAASNLLQEMGETFAAKNGLPPSSADKNGHIHHSWIKKMHRESSEISNEAHNSENRGEVHEHLHDLRTLHRFAKQHLKQVPRSHPKHAHAKQLVSRMGYHVDDVTAHHGSLMGHHDDGGYSATPELHQAIHSRGAKKSS